MSHKTFQGITHDGDEDQCEWCDPRLRKPLGLTEIERLRALNAELLAALEFVIDFKITDSNDNEVAEDSLHETRKVARAVIALAKEVS